MSWQIRTKAGVSKQLSGSWIYKPVILLLKDYLRRLSLLNTPISRINNIELLSFLVSRLQTIHILSSDVSRGK